MGCVNRLSNFLVKTDFLGKQFELKPNANEKNGTPLGGLLTWLILIFIFLFTVGKYLEETFQSLNQYSGEVQQIDSSDIQINGSNSILAFYFMKETENGANYVGLQNITQEFSIEVELVTKIKFQTGFQISKQNYQLIECNDFQKNIKQSNLDITPTQLYCFQGNYNLSSTYNKQLESNLQISFSKINPLEKNITKYFLRLIILQSQLSQDSTKSVSSIDKLTLIPYVYEYQFDMSTFKNVDVELSQVLIKQREEGMLSNLYGNNDYMIQHQGLQVNFQNIETKTQLENQSDSANFVLKFKNDGSQKIMLLNSQSLVITICLNLANFGGLLVSLLGIIGIFYGVYQKHKIIVSLMKNTFYFDFQEHNSNQNNIKNKELEKHIISINGSQLINLGSNMGKQIDYSFYQFLWMKTQESCQAVADLFGLDYKIEDKNEKMRIYRMAEQKIEQDLDITHILKRLYDIDKLKLLLLDEQQIQLFNTLAKPVIKIQKKKSLRLHRQSRQGTVNTQMLRVSQFFQSGAIIHDPKQLFYIYQSIKENQNRNIAMNQNILQLVKEHDLVQNILNKEETMQKIKQQLYHPDKIENKNQNSDKSCESEVNKKYLKDRAEKIQKPQNSHKSISQCNINNPKNQKSKQDFRESIVLHPNQKNILNINDLQQIKMHDPLKIQSLNSIQSPLYQKKQKILSQFSINQQSFGQVQLSFEEFNQSKQEKKNGSIYPNKLKLWSHRQSPFLAYKNKQSQLEQSPNQNSQTSNEDNQQNEYANVLQLNQDKSCQFDITPNKNSQILFLLDQNSNQSKLEKQSFSELQFSNNNIHPKIQSNQKQSTYTNQVIEKCQSKDSPCSSNLETSNISESIPNQQK
ncbi:transmembrane protein, putative (macronuclear) [Tetrahymena thermophila SB210]|uniref:Transmembrane protein, putative n=1 Tax=Tetrahymena thermophila (strain SB210) TaxID=312017 RepID=I7LW89_TETTS|nr:transmembrane protein, putative [Tetrahymena thermophila SB210]EAS01174.2 transmembrane protein, putative [Tetrahymena thermophila SB210]|eukprot:XP_001021419.2 transmembrane protein, putative [Tetrahymena thermophila SB210]